jgi:H+/Cl- antiporter ClcA
MLPDAPQQKPVDGGDQHARDEAIKAIEQRRRFWAATAVSAVIMAVLVVIWAISEYHNAGGWPTQGFSQSSGQPNVWNFWIIYPFMGWVLIDVAAGFFVYWRRPISEGDIKREIERQAGRR